MNITMKKSIHDKGWTAQSEAIIGQTADGPRVLRCSTSKRSNGTIGAFFSVHVRQEHTHNGTTYESETHVIFEDYARHSQPLATGRATEKNVRQAHEIALQYFDEHKKNALDHYAAAARQRMANAA